MSDLITSLKYLDGELDAKSKKAFEDELSVSKELIEEINLIKEINKTLSDMELMQFELKVKNSILECKKSGFSENIKYLPIRTLYSVAASIVILSGFFLYLYVSGPRSYSDRIFIKYYETYDADILIRSGSSVEDMMNIAINKYSTADYAGAIDIFKELISDENNSMIASFYTGLSYMELQDYQSALDYFNNINSSDSILKLHTLWYTGLVKIKLKDIDGAMIIFNAIASKEGYYQQRAIKILSKLDKI